MSVAVSPTPSQRDINAARVLVVDDEQYMCDVCKRILIRSGYQVTATVDPGEALRILRSGEQFDLLLTDIKMAGMSGLDLANIARECDPTIAIIIMTGFASLENLHQSVQRGVADFISKPFELDHLRLAVDQALHKRSILQDNVRLRALEHLLASGEALNSTLELNELSRILLNVTMEHSHCLAGFLFLVNESGLLQMTMTTSTEQAELNELGMQLAQQVYAEQLSYLSRDGMVGRFGESLLTHAFAVPLRAHGVMNGVLILCDDHEGNLRPGVQESVLLLAHHAGSALHNAHLYQRLDQAYQHLQELDRLKSEFISIASHELRTPLSLVLGYTSMVYNQVSGDKQEYLGRVMGGAQRIKEIVDDMVSLRHLERGEALPKLESFCIQDLVTQARDQVQALADNGQHTITLAMPPSALYLVSDYDKLLLILTHILSNAIKFTPPGGKSLVQVDRKNTAELIEQGSPLRSRKAQEDAPWLVISVVDNGIGIPTREHQRIFERFYQVAHSLTRDRGGIGLGLALARELVQTLGGVIWVVSQEGEGSTFSVALPFVQAATIGQQQTFE